MVVHLPNKHKNLSSNPSIGGRDRKRSEDSPGKSKRPYLKTN
jgi:hypothetical protein